MAAFCASAAVADDRASVVVLATRDTEIRAVKDLLACEGQASETIIGRSIHHVQCEGADVYLVRCGAGIVNAAMSAQMMIDRFAPDLVISIGLCAALSDDLAIGDVVIAESFNRHDIGSHTDAGFVQGTAWYRNDAIHAPDLMPRTNAWNELVTAMVYDTEKSFPLVNLSTGDSFIRSSLKRRWIRQKMQADIVDMSGAAIAEVAANNSVPVMVIRQISDYGDSEAGGSFIASASAPCDELGDAAAHVIDHWIYGEELAAW